MVNISVLEFSNYELLVEMGVRMGQKETML